MVRVWPQSPPSSTNLFPSRGSQRWCFSEIAGGERGFSMQRCIKDDYGLSTVAFFSSTLKLMSWTGEISIPRDISRTPTSFCIFPSRWQIFQSSEHHQGARDKGDRHPAPGDMRSCGGLSRVLQGKSTSPACNAFHCTTHLLSWNKATNSPGTERFCPMRYVCPLACPSCNRTSLHAAMLQQLFSNCWEPGQTWTKTDLLWPTPFHLPVTWWVAPT